MKLTNNQKNFQKEKEKVFSAIKVKLTPSVIQELEKNGEEINQDSLGLAMASVMDSEEVVKLVISTTLSVLRKKMTEALKQQQDPIALKNLQLDHPDKLIFSQEEKEAELSKLMESERTKKQIDKLMKPFIKIANADRDVSDPGFFAEKNLGKRRRPFADCNANMMPPPKLPRTG